ncbi:MAG: Rv3654c family TadE-like protein [Actinomycetota bacterium]
MTARRSLREERERGSVSVLVAAIIAVVVVLALGTADVARVLATAASAQTAADVSALAAVQELAMPSGLVPAEVAGEYAGRNGASLVSCECPVESFEAVVTVRMPVGTLLLFGDDRLVEAVAKAVVDLPA